MIIIMIYAPLCTVFTPQIFASHYGLCKNGESKEIVIIKHHITSLYASGIQHGYFLPPMVEGSPDAAQLINSF